jgi:hypothetical protein
VIQRLNELVTAKQTAQVMVTEEQDTQIFQQPLPKFLAEKRRNIRAFCITCNIEGDRRGSNPRPSLEPLIRWSGRKEQSKRGAGGWEIDLMRADCSIGCSMMREAREGAEKG